MCTSSFWKQFAVLTWKNNILRRRNWKSWLIEIAVPVLLTIGMVGLYGTVKVQVTERNVPGGAMFAAFDSFYKENSEPTCTFYDTNVFWRCSSDICDPATCEKLAFAFAPSHADDTATATAAIQLQELINTTYNGSISTMYFASEVELDKYIQTPGYAVNTDFNNIGAAIVFDSGAPDWKYHLRMNRTAKAGYNYLLPPTDLKTDNLLRGAYDWPKVCDRCWGQYLNMWYYSGALAIQNLADQFIISTTAGKPVKLSAAVVDFPSPRYESAGFWGIVSQFYGIWMVIAILYPVSNVVRNLVIEKEQRIREGMRMMALKDSALMASWAFHFGTTFTIIAGLIVIVGGPKLFQHSEKIYIFLYYLLFFYSTVSFAFWMSTLFSKSKTAAILGILPYFGGYFITMGINDNTTRSSKLLASLHPSAAFTLAMASFTEYEDAGQGITKNTVNTSASSNYAFGDALGMMFLDIFLYAILTWYFDKVWPSEFGTRLSPWFFLTPSYWKTVIPSFFFGPARTHTDIDVEQALAQEITPDIERVPDVLAQQIRDGKCIFIRDLNKNFKTNTGMKHAVDQLNLTMYSGQITALLGHNGAGKSTTIGILTGLISPSSGVALINGKDITRDMADIRHSLGVCPQHDVLFADLTVEEHLILFASFKGMPRNQIPAAVDEMIREVGLVEKRKVASKNLSGGMKRKLSVGIAFIGGSKVVFLDEPTSGMDPFSRRFTWNVIRKYKEGRTIILTTHFLDEADMLGDRVAIMNKGKLRACGSSLFLKNHFGVGYSLVIEKRPNADSGRLKHFVINKIPSAKILSNVGAEISFQLPNAASSSFQTLFEGLDDNRESLGVETYGISVTTLEEVFIRVTRGDETDAHGRAAIIERRNSLEEKRQSMEETRNSLDKQKSVDGGDLARAVGDLTPKDGLDIDYNDHWNFFRRHMYALFVKRLLYFSRDKKSWIYQFVMPALFVLVGCILMLSGINSIFAKTMPDLTLNTNVYNPGLKTYRLPIPFNQQNEPFSCNIEAYQDNSQYTTWNHQYQNNPNVTGQNEIMDAIPNLASFPVHSIPARALWNMSLELLYSRNDWKASRYGAFSFYNVSNQAGATAEFAYNLHVNYTGVHAAAVYQNLLNDAILRQFEPTGSLTTVVKPLAVTKHELQTSDSFNGFPVVIMIMLAFAFIPAAFALFVVRERETKAKHLQVVSGVSFLSYWLSTWIFDFASYQIPLWLTIIILKGFDVKPLMDGDAFGVTVILLELWGLSITGCTYMMSFMFAKHSIAQVGTILINFLFGLMLPIATIVLTFVSGQTRDIAKVLQPIIRLHPSYALGNGLLNVVFVDTWSLLDNKKYTVYSMEMAGAGMIYMAVECFAFFFLTLFVEYIIRRPIVSKFLGGNSTALHQGEVDEDVAREEARLKKENDDVVQIKDMTKIYPGGKMAVRGISLGIPNGECFGLLGINGAGKTTTLSILTAEFPQSSGQVSLGGYDISDNPDVVRRLVGYCPQFDALFDLLTGREHLELYARVKGLSEKQVKEVVDQKIQEMDLVEYAGRNASTYSGGNKRKLSVAMAMIGKPLIVFLDEPSTGMDAVARRFMWQVISDITTKRGECCIILTTHSMEECEALCTRIGIMVGGRLRCLGSAQRLKGRFGMGYQVEVSVKLPVLDDLQPLITAMHPHATDGKFNQSQLLAGLRAINKAEWNDRISANGSGSDIVQSVSGKGTIGVREFAAWCKLEERVDAVLYFIQTKFVGASLRERQGAKVRYEIPAKDPQGNARKLSQMFGVIEQDKKNLFVEDYSVSQTSLEQIFNFFAAQQEEEKGDAAGIVKDKQPTIVAPPTKAIQGPATKGEGMEVLDL